MIMEEAYTELLYRRRTDVPITGFALGLGAAAALIASPPRARTSCCRRRRTGLNKDPRAFRRRAGRAVRPIRGAAAVPTSMVTSFAPGDTVTMTISETVPHPGHYRAVLSTTGQGGLPADPQVTADSSALRIDGDPEPARLPGARRRDAGAHRRVQRGAVIHVQAAEQRDLHGNCVLQVAEFMSDHGLNNPGGCFYHHCANITIQAGGGTGTGGAAGDAGAGESGTDSGCGCAAGRGRVSALGLLGMLALVAARRRRRR